MIKCPKCGYQKPKEIDLKNILKGRKKALKNLKEIYYDSKNSQEKS